MTWLDRIWAALGIALTCTMLAALFFTCQIGIACFHGGDNPPGGQYETPILWPSAIVGVAALLIFAVLRRQGD